MDKRARAQALADQAAADGEPLRWFEEFYAESEEDGVDVPWADREPNPHLVSWAEERDLDGTDRLALVVGCGLGDDAEYLAGRGFNVVAFDLSETAVEKAKQRFPESEVEFLEADLFNLPGHWPKQFDFVLEIYTIQALPRDLRRQAIDVLPGLLADGGELLVICHGKDEDEPYGDLPYPLTKTDLDLFKERDLSVSRLDDFFDDEDPPKRRFRALYKRQSG